MTIFGSGNCGIANKTFDDGMESIVQPLYDILYTHGQSKMGFQGIDHKGFDL